MYILIFLKQVLFSKNCVLTFIFKELFYVYFNKHISLRYLFVSMMDVYWLCF